MEARLNRELSEWSQRHGLVLQQRQVRVDGTAGLASQAPCPTPLRVDPPADQALPLGRIQRQVSCPAEGWRYYIRARVSAVAELPVARHRLARGHTIHASDLTLAKRELGVSSQDWVFARDALVGQSVRRGIRADKPIRHSQVTAPNWVSLGQEVLIEAAGGGFSAVMKGVALDAGSEGQPVRVRNLSSGQVITAYPVAPGKVQTRF
ncbi:flagellar basal body P-ring formation chaperone FlgA [Ferrimonas balearica]|uniref:flagellar basal body P-ring formation chaperone FlgA n=1 Tax=Ferrimonas balearica TaxID=44012 RepID=UPI001C59A655|nr:flagellar basal body P-ring formation chaperone FlgA [Ferrimonas balearica]MBW3162992.1 flagellar basal body P-ring formation chaperone FlgA [Ferrimonas balearica]